MSLEKFQKLISEWIVLEPIIILYVMTNMNSVPVQNIYYDKYSRIYNFTYNSSILDDEWVDKNTNEFIRNNLLIGAGLSVLLMCIVGPTSDKYGRKFGLLWTVALTGR